MQRKTKNQEIEYHRRQLRIEKYTTEVVLQGFNSTFKMLDNRNSGSVDNNFSQDNAISDSSNFDSEIDDDIPF